MNNLLLACGALNTGLGLSVALSTINGNVAYADGSTSYLLGALMSVIMISTGIALSLKTI